MSTYEVTTQEQRMQQGLTYSFFFAALHLPLGVSGNLSWSLRNRQSVFKMPPQIRRTARSASSAQALVKETFVFGFDDVWRYPASISR
jgi:hypothetical protein